MKVKEYTPVDFGVKYDSNKPRYDLVCPRAFEEFVKVLTFGAVKYSPDNWKLVEPDRFISALYRHVEAYRKGEACDPETEFHHLGHAMCNLMFLLSKELENE
jgi:hypothetical protein